MMDVSQASHDLFLRILTVSGQATLLALLIVALQRLLRGHLSPGWRHALWSLLLVRLLLLWSVPTSLSLFSMLRNAWSALHHAVLAPAVLPPTFGESALPVMVVDKGISALEWAIGIWCCGAFLTLSAAILQAFRLHKQAKQRTQVTDSEVLTLLDECRSHMGIRRQVPILSGPDASIPALLGFIRPRLLVPASLLAPEARVQLRYVLLHELAHIRRQDVLTGWLAHLLLSLHWFNPVLWWAKRRCTEDRELACDARVLSLLTQKERRAYGHALLDQFRMNSAPFSSPGLVGVLEGTSSIERRIEMITSFDRTARKGTLPALLAVMLLTVTALTGEEEAVLAIQPVAAVTAPSAVSEPRVLLAMEQPNPEKTIIPTAVAELQNVEMSAPPQREIPTADAAAVTEAKAVEKTTAAKSKPVKKDRDRTAAAKDATKPAVMADAPQPAKQTDAELQESAAPEQAVSADKTEKADSNAPATLHNAINKAAADYARSLEVKSTRPGENLPFTLTVGGSIQVRGEYWSHRPASLSRGGDFSTSMRTRVSLCADFGQVQCAVEASKIQGGGGFFGPRDID